MINWYSLQSCPIIGTQWRNNNGHLISWVIRHQGLKAYIQYMNLAIWICTRAPARTAVISRTCNKRPACALPIHIWQERPTLRFTHGGVRHMMVDKMSKTFPRINDMSIEHHIKPAWIDLDGLGRGVGSIISVLRDFCPWKANNWFGTNNFLEVIYIWILVILVNT